MDEKVCDSFYLKHLMRLFSNPFLLLSFVVFIYSHKDQERTSRIRVIFCPHEIGRNTRQDNEATAELSHEGTSVLPWMGSACNTYACSHAHDRNRRRFRAILLRDYWEREGRTRRKATVARMGPYGSRMGPSAPWDENGAGKKGS